MSTEAQDRFSGVTHYTHVEVQPGGINIQKVEHLHQADILEALGIELQVKQKGSMTDRLDSEEADDLMAKLVDAGVLTLDWMPRNLSCTERGLVAKAVCDRLDIKEVWQVFGQLWHEKPESLRVYFNRALEQRKSLEYQEKLKKILD